MSYDVIRHAIDRSEDEVEAEIINDDVEIIEAPYPENGKAQIPKRSFIYDDEDGYPQDYFEHHGILGMKWGVRRYQNPDGSLTDAGRKHYGRNYTVRQLKKNIQDPNLSYSEKKALVSANKVNRMTKTKYRNAATSVATATTGIAGAGTLAGLMAAGVLSVNPLLPIAALAGGVVSGKAINAGREFLNAFRDLRVEMIDRQVDKQRSEKKPTVAMVPAGTLPESTRITGKEESDMWKAIAKTYEKQGNTSKPQTTEKKPPKYVESSQSRSYTPEQQKEKLSNARNNDRWDMEFLESVQNTKMSYNGDKAAMEKAYKDYLKDPEGFATMDAKEFYKKYPMA